MSQGQGRKRWPVDQASDQVAVRVPHGCSHGDRSQVGRTNTEPQQRADQRARGRPDDDVGPSGVPREIVLECSQHTGVIRSPDRAAATEHQPDARALIGDRRCGTVCVVHLANPECLGSVPAPARTVQEKPADHGPREHGAREDHRERQLTVTDDPADTYVRPVVRHERHEDHEQDRGQYGAGGASATVALMDGGSVSMLVIHDVPITRDRAS
jgi:hypothetical protein